MHPRRAISSSTTEGKVADYDKELHLNQPAAAAEGPGQRTRLDLLRAMFSTSTNSENETKRAMQSRHLMMIGEFL